jgi:hypothetical protein
LDRTLILSGKDHVRVGKKNAVQLPQPTAAEVEFAQHVADERVATWPPDTNQALTGTEVPGQGLDRWCAARDSNPEPAE